MPLKYDTYIARTDYQLDSDGKQTLFFRGQLQNDHYVPSTCTIRAAFRSFPDRPIQRSHSRTPKESRWGYTWIITPALVNSLAVWLHPAIVRQHRGANPADRWVHDLDNPVASTTPLSATIPVHDIEENLTWTHGAHTVVVGGSLRFIRTRRLSFANSYSDATMTPGWFVDNARYLLEPNVNPNTLSDYTNQMVNLLGLVSQGTADYNYNKQGALLPQGQGIKPRLRRQ